MVAGILTGNLAVDLLGILISLIVTVVAFFKWKFNYWKRLGVPSIDAGFPFGNTKKFLLSQEGVGETYKEFYDNFKSRNVKHGGIFSASIPEYMPIDPGLIKDIMQKDFGHFMNHGVYVNEQDDPLSGHLFNLEDDKWRQMRVKLTPTFTSGKMKMMFHTMTDCTKGFKDILEEHVKTKEPAEIKEILARFTTDIIGSVAFGLECNSLKDPDSEFRKYGRMTFEIEGVTEKLRNAAQFAFPNWFLKLIKFKSINPEVENFFLNVIKKTVNYREQNNVHRKDFLQLLLQLKNQGYILDDDKSNKTNGETRLNRLTFNELAAQAFVFFLAGFETSSTTSTFALYELACNQEIQQKLRNEIKTVLGKHNNELTYDAIQEMTYMDRVLQETLRKYPPVPMLVRMCNKNYTIPGTSIAIEKGTRVTISVLGLQRDPEYYPDPDKFDPERFTEENKAKRPAMTWIPFGEGPRLCIGLRFGLLQSKVALTALLKDYKISLNKKTVFPPEFEKKGFILVMDGGVWLNIEKI